MDKSTQNSFYQENLSIGEILRFKREEQGLTLEQVSQRLRIRLVFLKGLEEGKVETLPGTVYASGFLRAYAELLGLDAEILVQRFRNENHTYSKRPALMFPAPVPQSGVPAAVMVLFSLIIIVSAYIGWYKMTDHQVMEPEAIPSVIVNDQQKQTDMKISPQIASVMPSDHPNLSPQEQQGIAEHIQRMEADARAVQDKQLEGYPKPPPSSLPENTPTTEKSDATSENKPVEVKQEISLYAQKSSWLLVKDQDGHVLYQNTLKQGEKWTLPDDVKEVIATIGNAGGVVLEKNGKQSDPIGQKGKKLRRFVINDKILKKFFPDGEKDQKTTQTKTTDTKLGNSDTGKPQENSNLKKQDDTEGTFVNTPPKPEIKPKKTVKRQPQVKELSADELNARQLNR